MSTTQLVGPEGRDSMQPASTAADAGPRNPGLALLVIATAQLMVVLDADHRQRRAAAHPAGARLLRDRPGMGRQRLRADLRRAAAARRPGRGPARPPQDVHRRAAAVLRPPRWPAGSPPPRPGCSRPARCRASAARWSHPAALALITTTFAEGPARNRAMGVYAAMSGGGGAVGLIAGGAAHHLRCPGGGCCSSTCRSASLVAAGRTARAGRVGRAAAAGSTCPARSPARPGSPLLVYGLSNAGTDQHGVSHWGDAKVVASLAGRRGAAGRVRVIESRSRHALHAAAHPRQPQPHRRLPDHARASRTAMFGIFFFLTIFVQAVLGLQRR